MKYFPLEYKDAPDPDGKVLDIQTVQIGEDIDSLVLSDSGTAPAEEQPEKKHKVSRWGQVLLELLEEVTDVPFVEARERFRAEFDRRAALPGTKIKPSSAPNSSFRKSWGDSWKKLRESGHILITEKSVTNGKVTGEVENIRKLGMFERL